MAILQIGLSIDVGSDEIKRCLSAWYPSLEITTLDEMVASARNIRPPIVFAVIRTDAIDFPTLIDVLAFPETGDADVSIEIALARCLSEALGCRTICDGRDYGVPSTPFWSIIWDRGRSFLADDCGSAFVDGAGDPVRIVREIFLPAVTVGEKV